MLEEGQLVVVRPPIENIIASKMLRVSAKDLTDIAYLMDHYDVPKQKVANVIRSFPPGKRAEAEENMVYLKMMGKGVDL